MTSRRSSIATALSRAKSNNAALATSSVGVGPAAAVVSVMISVMMLASNSMSNYSSRAEKKEDGERLDVYLMDRIAKKSYLNYHSAVVSSSRNQQQQQHQQAPDGGTKLTHIMPDNTRPKGVPSRLRILTVDVPEFKQDAFHHGVICQLPTQIFDTNSNNTTTTKPSSSLEFVDGVAPSKPMNKTLGHNERTGTRDSRKPILQKSLAKQLYYCYKSPQLDHRSRSEQQKKQSTTRNNDETHPPVRIGAEILETSVLDLNPNNIRRFYTSTSKKYRYDPGKYTTKQQQDDASGIADSDEDEIAESSLEQSKENIADEQSTTQPNEFEEKDIDDPDYERTAPWNQYAWLEEMHLRIHGLVPFGAPMQRASVVSQWLYGRIYHQSIPISSSRGGWLSWLWWPSWSGSYAVGSPRYRTSWDGVDGEGERGLIGDHSGGRSGRIIPRIFSSKAALNRASNKPHAVICDGSALQRVPGSLRYLSKLCREAGIPLYILNDPRTWGSQTHSTLSDAIVDMRKSITENVIHHALDLREGTAFERGRFVGRLEKEVAWQAYDAARRTRDNLMDARRRLRRDKVADWSELGEEELLRQLIDRKVITLRSAGAMDNMNDGGSESGGKPGQSFKCSEGFAGLCRRVGTDSKHSPTSEKSMNKTD